MSDFHDTMLRVLDIESALSYPDARLTSGSTLHVRDTAEPVLSADRRGVIS
jgi:hypothetical protein